MEIIERVIPKGRMKITKRIIGVVLILAVLGSFFNIEIINKIMGRIVTQIIMLVAGYFLLKSRGV